MEARVTRLAPRDPGRALWPRSRMPKSLGSRGVATAIRSPLRDTTVVNCSHKETPIINTTVASDRMAEASPRLMARMAGLFYLLTILAGIFAQYFVSNKLVVFGDASTTATNILAHKKLFQWGFAVYLVEMTCQITSIALFYFLLKPVSRSVSLLAAFIGLAGCTIKALSRLFYIVPLFVLGGEHYLGVFNPEQLNALALLLLEVNNLGAGIALAFFGFLALLKGYLIVRSTFLPRVLGMLSILAGLGLLTFLSPALGNRMFPYVAPIGLLGAVAQIFWLLVFGVNERRWKDQARTAAASIWR